MRENLIKKYIDTFNHNDEELYSQCISNADAETWMMQNVPVFTCNQPLFEEAYYFRWWVFRKHLKATPEGTIITEFLPPVRWSGPYNSINCAVGHHLSEARWLKCGRELIHEYVDFWFKGSGNQYAYSSWIIDAIKNYAILWSDAEYGVQLLPHLVTFYQEIETHHLTRYGLFWSNDDRDAMECSISGSGLRPTLNSYMYANALGIAYFAEQAGDSSLAKDYRNKASLLKQNIIKYLWDSEEEFFKVIPLEDKDAQIATFDFKQIPKQHNVKELIGYLPWLFGIAEDTHARAWRYLSDPMCFHGEYGLTTAARDHLCYNLPSEKNHECLWNGPSWPFATTQTIDAMIASRQNKNSSLKATDISRELLTYANSFYRNKADGTKVNWLDENIDPDTGEWLSRKILKDQNWPIGKGGYERGKDYNHSAFSDLFIRGYCGIHLSDEGLLTIDPIKDTTLEYFSFEDLPMKGDFISVWYDRSGEHFGKGVGITVLIDGKHYQSKTKIEISL